MSQHNQTATSEENSTPRFIVVLSDETCLVRADFKTLALTTAMDSRKAQRFTRGEAQAAVRLISAKDPGVSFQPVRS